MSFLIHYTENDNLYININDLTDTSDITFITISILYIIFGIVSIIIILFTFFIFIKHLTHKKNIYSLLKITFFFELILSIHIAKNGIVNLYGMMNRLYCQLDSGVTFFSQIIVIYYYIIIISYMIIYKTSFPKINSLSRTIIGIPAYVVGLSSVILIYKLKMSGYSTWNTCFINNSNSTLFYLYFLIPSSIFFILTIIFFILVYKRRIILKNLFQGYHIFSLFNSLSFLIIIINFFIQNSIFGCIGYLTYLMNISYFRISNDVNLFVFKNNQMTSNKFVFFVFTLLGIDQEPLDSFNIEYINDITKTERLTKNDNSKIYYSRNESYNK